MSSGGSLFSRSNWVPALASQLFCFGGSNARQSSQSIPSEVILAVVILPNMFTVSVIGHVGAAVGIPGSPPPPPPPHVITLMEIVALSLPQSLVTVKV